MQQLMVYFGVFMITFTVIAFNYAHLGSDGAWDHEIQFSQASNLILLVFTVTVMLCMQGST